MTPTRTTAALMVAALGLVSCTNPSTEPDAAAVPASSAPARASLVLPTVDGGQLEFADVLGQDTMLWFWAPW